MERAKVPFKFVLALYFAAPSLPPDASARGALCKLAGILVGFFAAAIRPAPPPRAGRLTGGVP